MHHKKRGKAGGKAIMSLCSTSIPEVYKYTRVLPSLYLVNETNLYEDFLLFLHFHTRFLKIFSHISRFSAHLTPPSSSLSAILSR